MTKTRPDARCLVAADGQVSAALEEIRERSSATKAAAHGYRPRGERLPGGPCGEWLLANLASAQDVPLLLAVVDAVLGPHQPGRIVLSGALCARHENHRYFSITQREADDVIACEACPATVYTSCDGCGTHIPFESCRTRRRITRALLGDAGEVQP